METTFSPEQREEYDAELDLETKKKILGGNIARLYDIDIEKKKQELQDDRLSQELGFAQNSRSVGDD